MSAQNVKIPRNIYSPRVQVLSPKGETPAQQQFKEDCDLNTIMKRFTKTGAIDHVSEHQLQYGFASPLQYHESMNVITTAQSMFNDLPSKLRNEFNNNPQAFLTFVQDPKNSDRAKELGITLSPQAQIKADELQAAAEAEKPVPEVAVAPAPTVPVTAPPTPS